MLTRNSVCEMLHRLSYRCLACRYSTHHRMQWLYPQALRVMMLSIASGAGTAAVVWTRRCGKTPYIWVTSPDILRYLPMESRVLSILDQSYQNDLQFLSQRLEPVQSNASQQNDDTRNISVMKLQYVLRTPLCQLVPEDKNEKKRKKRRS